MSRAPPVYLGEAFENKGGTMCCPQRRAKRLWLFVLGGWAPAREGVVVGSAMEGGRLGSIGPALGNSMGCRQNLLPCVCVPAWVFLHTQEALQVPTRWGPSAQRRPASLLHVPVTLMCSEATPGSHGLWGRRCLASLSTCWYPAHGQLCHGAHSASFLSPSWGTSLVPDHGGEFP